VKTIYVDNEQRIPGHISNILYLVWFLRFLINTLSRKFENMIGKQPSKNCKPVGLFGEFYSTRKLLFHLTSPTIKQKLFL